MVSYSIREFARTMNSQRPLHISPTWASSQIRKIACSTCARNAENGFPTTACWLSWHASQHVPWCMPGSLTSDFLWSQLHGKRSRHSRRMHNPYFCVSGQRPHGWALECLWEYLFYYWPSYTAVWLHISKITITSTRSQWVNINQVIMVFFPLLTVLEVSPSCTGLVSTPRGHPSCQG